MQLKQVFRRTDTGIFKNLMVMLNSLRGSSFFFILRSEEAPKSAKKILA